MRKDFTADIIYFPEVYDIAFRLSQKITNRFKSFDAVIAIARGGLPPARLICDFLNISTLTSLQIRHYAGGAEEMEETEITDPVDIDLSGKKVLIVDDVNDSGKTLRAAHQHVQSLGPSLLRTAVLHEKEKSIFQADFTGKALKQWSWLIYQWAVTEDLLEFLKRDDMLHASEKEAIHHLAVKYNLEIGKELFRKVAAMKESYFANKSKPVK